MENVEHSGWYTVNAPYMFALLAAAEAVLGVIAV